MTELHSAELAATIAVQAIGLLLQLGGQKRAQQDNDRRFDVLEKAKDDHEGRISNVEGKLSIALPARAR